MAGTPLLIDRATSGNGSVAYWDGASSLWSSWGEFDGATLTLQFSPDAGTTWLDVATQTEAGFVNVGLPSAQVRVVVADAGGSTLITSSLFKAQAVGASVIFGGVAGGATAANQETANSRAGIKYYSNPTGRILNENEQGAPTGNVNGIPYQIVWDPVTNAPAIVGTDMGLLPTSIVGTASFTPAAAVYGAGDLVDVAKEFVFTYTNGDPIPAASRIRILTSTMKINVTGVPAGQTSFALRAYTETPATASQADNDVWALAAADLTIYRGPINLGTPVDEGAALYVRSQYIDSDIDLTGVSLFARLVTAGGYTAAAVAHQVKLIGMVI